LTGDHHVRANLAPLAAVLAAIVSITLGATVAKRLFVVVGPAGTTALRLTIAALILAVVFKVWRVSLNRRLVLAALPYGLCLGAMNLMFYMSIERIPLGVALAVEFIGPLAVATFGSRRWADLVWVSLAIIGLFLVLPSDFGGTPLDPIGLVLALAAGVFWGAYIFAGKRAGDAIGSAAPAYGMIVAALLTLPFGVAEGGARLLTGPVLGWGLIVALLSSAIPYTLEMFALRRLPAKTYGVLTSGEPAVGALMGAVMLSETLPAIRWLGIGAIVAASLGTTMTARPDRDRSIASEVAAP
jgi:inner membrane transporter RhtA